MPGHDVRNCVGACRFIEPLGQPALVQQAFDPGKLRPVCRPIAVKGSVAGIGYLARSLNLHELKALGSDSIDSFGIPSAIYDGKRSPSPPVLRTLNTAVA
jgi:hypothetical protein